MLRGSSNVKATHDPAVPDGLHPVASSPSATAAPSLPSDVVTQTCPATLARDFAFFPLWVTVTVYVLPFTTADAVPERLPVDVFSETFTVITMVPCPPTEERERVAVIQLTLDWTPPIESDPLDVKVNFAVCVPPDAPNERLAPEPPVFPLCVTVNVAVFDPPVTVIFPVREALPVFAATSYTMVPLPLPLPFFTFSQDTFDFAVHDTFAFTDSSLLLAADALNDRLVAPSVSVPLLPFS